MRNSPHSFLSVIVSSGRIRPRRCILVVPYLFVCIMEFTRAWYFQLGFNSCIIVLMSVVHCSMHSSLSSQPMGFWVVRRRFSPAFQPSSIMS